MRTKFTLRVGLVLLWAFCALACRDTETEPLSIVPSHTSADAVMLPTSDIKPDGGLAMAGQSVYVCKSAGAKKYHFNRNCGGLKRCSHEIKTSSVKEAEAIGLTQCAYKKCR
ncbi:hypothetical protein [Flavobacterium agri]|nr:hypothetical protein [Flavobacterium agri]